MTGMNDKLTHLLSTHKHAYRNAKTELHSFFRLANTHKLINTGNGRHRHRKCTRTRYKDALIYHNSLL